MATVEHGAVELFAGAAALLAFVGVYSVMAYGVARAHERLACGSRLALVRSMLRERSCARRVADGCRYGRGLALSALLASVLGKLLFGITPGDPLTFSAVCAVAVVAGLLATCIPAVTAARVDPTVALRGDRYE